MDVDANKAIVRRLYDEGFNRCDLALLDELLAPAFVDRTASPGQAPGAAGIKDAWRWFHAAFPDAHITVDELIAEGDQIAACVTMRGTHHGTFLGVPPTGKTVAVNGLEFCRIAGGKIVELRSEFGTLGALRQLGVSPQWS